MIISLNPEKLPSNEATLYITYNSVKFFKFPNFSGMVPAKLLEDRDLWNEETVSKPVSSEAMRENIDRYILIYQIYTRSIIT